MFRPTGISATRTELLPGTHVYKGERWPGNIGTNWQALPHTARFRESEWSVDHRIMPVLAEFFAKHPTGLNDPNGLNTANGPQTWLRPVDKFTDTQAAVQAELDELRALVEHRPSALDETIQQRWGVLSYFRGVVNFTPSSHRNTFMLIYAGQVAATMAAMHFKLQWKRPRPSRLDPQLLPPVEVSAHPAFPSAHATESMMVALLLEQVLPQDVLEATQAELAANPLAAAVAARAQNNPLRTLARRIARNREILGVHYPSDSFAGFKLAARAFGDFLALDAVSAPTGDASGENQRLQPPLDILGNGTVLLNTSNATTALGKGGLLARARAEWKDTDPP